MDENFYGDIGYGVPDDMSDFNNYGSNYTGVNPQLPAAWTPPANYDPTQDFQSNTPSPQYGPLTSQDTSFWSQLSGVLNKLPMDKLLTAGLGTFGAINSSNAMSDAAKQSAAIQQQNSLAQLAQMQKMYEQQRADFAPYQAIGEAGALRLAGRNVPSAPRSELNRLMGRG